MIKERYCSYEVAKLLKEKGFDGDVNSFYAEPKQEIYPCPTHQMAMDWLRDKDVFISIEPYVDDPRIVWSVYTKDYDLNWVKRKHDEEISYEEAIEEALKYCLTNLI